MPDRPQCINPTPSGSPTEPPAVPPALDPAKWEDFPVFRETFLMYFTEPPSNSALRIFGRLFHDLVLEYYRHWPNWPEGVTATELRSALADLRHLEGYLGAVGREHEEAALTEAEATLSQLAARLAGDLARIANEIEQALWRSGPMTSSGMHVHQLRSRAANFSAASLQALCISRVMIFAWEGR